MSKGMLPVKMTAAQEKVLRKIARGIRPVRQAMRCVEPLMRLGMIEDAGLYLVVTENGARWLSNKSTSAAKADR